MKIMRMNEKDFYVSLKNLSSTIHYLYMRLYTLEINGLKDSKDYNEIIDCINKYKTFEKVILNMIKNKTFEIKDDKFILRISAIATVEVVRFKTPEGLISENKFVMSKDFNENDYTCMRMNSLISDMYFKSFTELSNDTGIFDTLTPKKIKIFLDILEDVIKNIDDKKFKKSLIKAKYNLAFVNSGEYVDKEITESEKEHGYSEITNSLCKLARRYSTLNKDYFYSPKNAKRLTLESTYIRACLAVMDEEGIEIFYQILFDMIKDENLDESEGLKIFFKLIDMYEEDKKLFNNEGYSFKRKF